MRGKRKIGAWDCQIWLADGAKFQLKSLPERTFTNAQILESIEKNLLPMLKASVEAESKKAGPDA